MPNIYGAPTDISALRPRFWLRYKLAPRGTIPSAMRPPLKASNALKSWSLTLTSLVHKR